MPGCNNDNVTPHEVHIRTRVEEGVYHATAICAICGESPPAVAMEVVVLQDLIHALVDSNVIKVQVVDLRQQQETASTN